MRYPDIDGFHTNDRYVQEIHPNVWLMDDHKWAYYVWEGFLLQDPGRKPLSLVHMDYHWDGVNDFSSIIDQENLRRINNLKEIRQLVSNGINVRKDSFLAPAIIREIIKEVHFYCFQTDTEVGIDEELLKKCKSKQSIHRDLSSLTKRVPKKNLYDLDLDLFNKSDYCDKRDLWTDEEVLSFLCGCSHLIKNSPLITIAMSFSYSGSDEDTKHLTRLVVPKLMEYFTGCNFGGRTGP